MLYTVSSMGSLTISVSMSTSRSARMVPAPVLLSALSAIRGTRAPPACRPVLPSVARHDGRGVQGHAGHAADVRAPDQGGRALGTRRKLVRVNLPKSLACFSSLLLTVRPLLRQH